MDTSWRYTFNEIQLRILKEWNLFHMALIREAISNWED
jgi:hypothetical protein